MLLLVNGPNPGIEDKTDQQQQTNKNKLLN